MKKLFSIGQTSRINDVTIRALRLYDEKDILKPAYVDESNGYRYYSIEQFIKIDVLNYSKYLGISLKEIKEIFSKEDMDVFIDFLDKQKIKAKKELLELQNLIEDIDSIKDKIDYGRSISSDKNICIKHIDRRYIISEPVDTFDSISDRILLYKDLYKKVKNHNLRDGIVTGYIINTDSFIKDINVIYEKVYLEVKEDKNCEIVSQIPEGNYLCISYNEDDRHTLLNKIHSYIKDNKIHCKLIVESEYIENLFEEHSSIFEIQILL